MLSFTLFFMTCFKKKMQTCTFPLYLLWMWDQCCDFGLSVWGSSTSNKNENVCNYLCIPPPPLGLVHVFYERPLNYLSPRLYQVSLSLNLNFLLESFVKTEYVSQCYVVYFVMQLKSFLSLVSMGVALANLFTIVEILVNTPST